jgi:hypothetical protein
VILFCRYASSSSLSIIFVMFVCFPIQKHKVE